MTAESKATYIKQTFMDRLAPEQYAAFEEASCCMEAVFQDQAQKIGPRLAYAAFVILSVQLREAAEFPDATQRPVPVVLEVECRDLMGEFRQALREAYSDTLPGTNAPCQDGVVALCRCRACRKVRAMDLDARAAGLGIPKA